MSYTPQPGTFPARAVEFFKSKPTGFEMSSAELAEELGQPAVHVAPLLAHARERGAVSARKDGKLIYWSLGDNVPIVRERDEPLHAEGERQTKPRTTLAQEFASMREAMAEKKPKQAQQRKAKHSADFRAGLFTDGSLQIEIGGETVHLNAEQVSQIAKLLARAA